MKRVTEPAAHRCALPWDERLVGYDFGPSHPLAPVRVELTMALARAFGVLDRPSAQLIDVPPAGDDLLGLVHTADYLDAVRRRSATLEADVAHGLGTMDDPVFAGMHDAAAMVAAATVAAARP